MKFLGNIVLFIIWGVLSLIVLPEIAKVNTIGQILFVILWIGVLLVALFLFDPKSRNPMSDK